MPAALDDYRYNLQLRRALRRRLGLFTPRAADAEGLRCAAVTLTVVGAGDRVALFPKEYPIFADWHAFRHANTSV